ncbi:MAG: phosphohistidine phosphatase [Gemmatimonadetes bacterium]|nr:phosphohistidine phosphatase [Gemmatimonadota bacterium]
MRLYLLRHGIAIDREDPDCPPDPERQLTERGVLRTRAAVAGLKRLGVAPDVILSSPWRRARQTADIAAGILEGGAEVREADGMLPHDDPVLFFSRLPDLGAGAVLCAGHNPHLNGLLAAATGQPGSFTWLKKAGCACLQIRDGWGTLEWLMTSKALRRIGDAE